ncbi:hypothetical protein EPN16_02585 [bacterium]|nr:MAG: hypothetical protein EPN16_02585 [bacterium]
MNSGKIKTAKACEHITLFSIYVIAFFLPISKAIIESFSILAIIAYLTKKFLNFENLPKTPISYGIFAYLPICVISVFFSSNPATSSNTFLRKTLQDIIFFFVVFETLNSKQKLRNIIYVLFLSSLLIGIDGIYQYFTHKDFIRHRKDLAIPRIYASFPYPNAFGCYLSAVMPFVLTSVFAKYPAKILKFFSFCLFILLFTCLLLTVSRGAWFAFSASALFMSMWLRILGIFLLTIGIFIIVALQFFHPYIKERLRNLFIFTDTSGMDRKIIWQAGWKMFISKPWLGVGLGTFMFNFKNFVIKDYPHGAVYAHNCYLQMAAEIGVIGLAAFLLILALFFHSGIKTLNAKERSFSWYVLLASQAAILGYCVQMGVDTTLYSLDLGMLFWLVLGIGVAAMKNLQSACATRK